MPELRENDPNTLLLLGEIRGQLRELIHTGNNTSQMVTALGDRVGKLETANARIDALEAMAPRLIALESDRSRREGASGVLVTIMRSPTLGWLVGAAITAWAILTGKVHV